ncbi:MAG: hypothetical protein ACR2PW_02630, partial [Gammaproteobacteria bacterium]
LVVQYQSAANRLSWSADVGMLNEPHSWQGLSSFNSPYGDFKSQMDYVGVKGIWCLDAAVMHCQTGTSSWNLGAAFSWSQLDLDQKQSVLLQDIQGLEEYQLKLSLMGQSLWHAQDWLQLSVGWQMTLGESFWVLPTHLYRGEIQYSSVTHAFSDQVQTRVQGSYHLPLGTSPRNPRQTVLAFYVGQPLLQAGGFNALAEVDHALGMRLDSRF